MFVGNEEKVYMIDKSENNPSQINGHPAWGSVWCVSLDRLMLHSVLMTPQGYENA